MHAFAGINFFKLVFVFVVTLVSLTMMDMVVATGLGAVDMATGTAALDMAVLVGGIPPGTGSAGLAGACAVTTSLVP